MEDQTQAAEPSKPAFRPSDFMRARRPHLFSDSTRTVSGVFTKDVFSNHLGNITAENKESQFQKFCDALARKEIARNLLPQTGPVGGGDGKVDAETYPVDAAIAETWFEATPLEASSERWAFAISAKAKWKSKLDEEVVKVLGTQRGYTKLYFMTNQFVRSKDQSYIRDTLLKEKGIEVWILDRNWIIETVFGSNHLKMAAEILSLPAAGTEIQTEVGPNDAERLIELREIEEHLANPEYYNGTALQKIADCIEAAKLARGLEKPREEVDRLFYRAKRLADSYGSAQQKLRVAYNQAWTAYWWHNDFEELNSLYSVAVGLAAGSVFIEEMELVCNLWSLVHSASVSGHIAITKETIEERANHVRAELNRFIENAERPNAQHQAKMMALHHEFILEAKQRGAFEKYVPRFIQLVEDSRDHLDFPMENAAEIYTEFGDSVVDSDAYDKGLELIAKLMGERNQETTAGEMLLNRGRQKLGAKRYVEAIRILGRAQNYLAKDETKRNLRDALGGCSDAYEQLGLLWAARSNMLMVANIMLSKVQSGEDVPPGSVAPARKMAILELQLGRVWYTLSWMEMVSVIGHVSVFDREKQKWLNKEMETLETILGIQILRTPLKDLERLALLPDVLDKMGLFRAWSASMYALGYEHELRESKVISDAESPEEIRGFYGKWIQQPANEQVRAAEYFHGPTVTMDTTLLGCNVKVEADPDRASIELGETILSALEAFLSTSLDSDILGIRHRYVVRVTKDASVLDIGSEIIEDGGSVDMKVTHSGILKYGSPDERKVFGDHLSHIVVNIIPRIVMSEDLVKDIEALVRDEEVLGRAYNFMNSGTVIYNTLGAKPKLSIESWAGDRTLVSRPLRRTTPWFDDLPAEPEPETPVAPAQPGGKLRAGIPEAQASEDGGFASHDSISISRVINHALWEQAKWGGTMFLVSFRQGPPPYLGLGFENLQFGKAIFAEWKRYVADMDEDEFLEVTIITGIDKDSPHSYRVMLAPGKGEIAREKKRFVAFAPRCRTMDPDKPYLQQFLIEYRKAGSYYLIPASQASPPNGNNPLENGYLKMTELTVIPAWEIDEDHSAMMALEGNEDVVIPEGVANPPIQKALAKRKQISTELKAKKAERKKA